MPYIIQDRRAEIRPQAEYNAVGSGELHYQLTVLILAYLQEHGPLYQTMNDIVGALESAKAEFQRRVVGPYEDMKIAQNGDVYP